jgi:hypothetical protein
MNEGGVRAVPPPEFFWTLFSLYPPPRPGTKRAKKSPQKAKKKAEKAEQ